MKNSYFTLIIISLIISCKFTGEVKIIGSIEKLGASLDATIIETAIIEKPGEGYEWSEGSVWLQPEKMFSYYIDVPNDSGRFKPSQIKSIYLVKIHDDKGNHTRHVLEIKLDRNKIKEMVDDLNATRHEGSFDLEKMFTIIIKARNNIEYRLVGKDKILFDKENANYYVADFSWTSKYWNKDLSLGGF